MSDDYERLGLKNDANYEDLVKAYGEKSLELTNEDDIAKLNESAAFIAKKIKELNQEKTTLPSGEEVTVEEIKKAIDEKINKVHIDYDNSVPKPRNRKINETDEEYEDYLEDFYQLDKQGLQYSYLGALMCDFKYRKREALWKDAFEYTFRPGQEDDCKGQFMAYKNMKTIYFGTCTGEFGNTSDKFINPVHEVWALYPNMKEPKSIEFKAGYGIRLISSMPGNEDVLDKCMKSFIN